MWFHVWLFICLFGVFCLKFVVQLEIFTHLETSPLIVKRFNFWPILGTHDLWALSVLKRTIPTVTRYIPFYCLFWGPLTLTLVDERLATYSNDLTHTDFGVLNTGVDTELNVLKTWVWRSLDTNTQTSVSMLKTNALAKCHMLQRDVGVYSFPPLYGWNIAGVKHFPINQSIIFFSFSINKQFMCSVWTITNCFFYFTDKYTWKDLTEW